MKAKIKDKEESFFYEIYMSDIAKALLGSFGGQVNSRFIDLIDTEKKISNEKPEDIISRIKSGVNFNLGGTT